MPEMSSHINGTRGRLTLQFYLKEHVVEMPHSANELNEGIHPRLDGIRASRYVERFVRGDSTPANVLVGSLHKDVQLMGARTMTLRNRHTSTNCTIWAAFTISDTDRGWKGLARTVGRALV